MIEMLKLSVIQRAFVATLIAGGFLPLAGSISVLSDTSFLAAGFAHIAFAGVALGYLLRFDPILGAFLITVISAYFLWYLSEKREGKYEQTLSILFSFFMALAILFFGLTRTYASDAMSYLFGSPLMANSVDLILLAAAFLLYLFFVIYYHRILFQIVFSNELSLASGINVSRFRLYFFLFTALSVVLSMKSVGALVVYGLMIIPPSLSQRISKHFNQMIVISVIFGILSSFIGFILSLIIDVPVGAAVVVTSAVFYFISLILKR
ncbi:MAG: metal ABC transporter permease [bacterium]|nr:metal ABC transporter permease [bacterium]